MDITFSISCTVLLVFPMSDFIWSQNSLISADIKLELACDNLDSLIFNILSNLFFWLLSVSKGFSPSSVGRYSCSSTFFICCPNVVIAEAYCFEVKALLMF